jgi:hypothetical protein
MCDIFQKEFVLRYKAGRCIPKLSIQDKLYVTLQYLREYRIMESEWVGARSKIRFQRRYVWIAQQENITHIGRWTLTSGRLLASRTAS